MRVWKTCTSVRVPVSMGLASLKKAMQASYCFFMSAKPGMA
jgi:hypothetical protein